MSAHRGRSLLPALLLASSALGGCAARQPSVFVLLPEPTSASSAVTVTNAHGSQVLSRPYEAIEVAGPAEAPRAPAPLDRKELERVFGEALGAMPRPPVHFVLYFESASTDLTAASRASMPAILAAIEERRPAAVGVVGHTDTTGGSDRNTRLSLRRAEAVAALLRSLGAAPASLETESHGEADLLVPTADGVAEPRNRRVEVTVR